MSNRTTITDSIRNLSIPRTYIAPLLITGVLVAAHTSFGILDSYTRLLVSIGAAILTESILHKLTTGKWRNLSSAYISGISAGILVRSPIVWPFAFCAAVSIASKYVLRYKNRHIWNPTNFGVVAVILLVSDYAAILNIQWGNHMWAMFVIWIIGFITLWKVKLFHISIVYVGSFLVFAWVRSLITGDSFLTEAAPITGPMYQLFILFMITDPKTTVSSWSGRCLVAFLIALTEMFLRLNEMIYAPFYALFIIGPAAMVIDLWLKDREPDSELNPALKKASETG